MDWRKETLKSLRRRNRRETSFGDLVTRFGGSSSSVESHAHGLESLEKTSILEQKLFRVQEELTELHRKKGDNAQRVIDLTVKLQDLEKTLETKETCLTESESLVEVLRKEIDKVNEDIKELSGTNQLLKDEYQTLQLALNSADTRLVEAGKENDRLVSQIIELKEKDVLRMNIENDTFVERMQLQVQQQLREAAEEKAGLINNMKVQHQTVGNENLSLMICHAVRLPTRSFLKIQAHEGEVNSLAWTNHKSALITGGSDRKIKFWDISKGIPENRGLFSGCNGSIMSLNFDSSGCLVLGASGDYASRVWSVEGFRIRHTLTGHSGKVMSAKFLLDSNKFISGSQDRTIKVWDLRSKACISTKFVGSICNDLVTNESMVISGHFDKKLRFYDCRNLGSSSTGFSSEPIMPEVTIGGKITSLDLSRNGLYLLACTRQNEIQILDLRQMKVVLQSLTSPGFQVSCDWTRATFSPDSEYVACGSNDGSLYIWKYDVEVPERILKESDAAIIATSWQPAGNGIATCDKNKTVTIWADI